MGKRDPRVDAYITKSPDFAKPILTHIRDVVLAVPASFKKALSKNKKAMAAFEAFSPSHKREYIEWITDAKSEETRDRRIGAAIEWITEGKPRNWKYMKR